MMASAKPKRARTDEQKFQRRQAILEAADRHFRDVGFEAFSMAMLARQAGLAKGTLYLYFSTREEVFLALHARQLEQFSENLFTRLEPGMSDDDFVSMFFEAAMDDAAFVSLLMRLDHVIEQNVSIEALIASKRMSHSIIEVSATRVSAALNLTAEQATDCLQSLASLLIGSARVNDQPTLDEEDLPQDVRAFIESFDPKTTFTRNARRIIAGIRAGQ